MRLLLQFFFLGLTAMVSCISTFEQGMDAGYSPSIYVNCSKFQPNYTRWNYQVVEPSKEPLIPKKIHQIWLGGEVPKQFVSLMQTWKTLHPDWEYRLWTDKDLDDFPFINRAAFDRALNLGTKADILRYDILYVFGGVYVDVDFECVRPLDALVHAHYFFAGIEGFDWLSNAIIGACPGLSLFKRLALLINQWDDEQLKSPWTYTGPLTFTKQVYQFLRSNPERACIYPTRFFFPFPNIYRHDYWRGCIEPSFIKGFFIDETFAVHHWAESWNK